MLSALGGNLLGRSTTVPFLLDVEVYTRFLLATPLLIGAEVLVHQRMRFLVKQFLERNLIPEYAMKIFNGAIASAFRLRNSVHAAIAFHLRICNWRPRGLAPLHRDRRGHLVRDAVCRR